MPRYRVTTPDGRKFVVNAPEGATQEQALAFARKESAARPRTGGSGIGWLDKIVSAGNEALIGIPQGIQNMGAAVTDPISRAIFGEETVKQAQQSRQGAYDAASRALVTDPNPTARTVGQIGGSMVVPLPKIPGAGKMIQTANRAVQGALSGAAVRDSDESAIAPSAAGAAANVLLPPLLAKAVQSKPVRAAARALVPAGRPLLGVADNAAEAVLSRARPRLGLNYSPIPASAPQLPISPAAPLAPLGRKAEVRAARLRSLGIEKPTTGMVTRDPKAFSFEQNAARMEGVGEDLAQQIRGVEAGLVKKGQDLVRSAGGARGAEATGESVQKALDAKRAEMQQVTSKLYDQVRSTRGEDAVGPPSWLLRRLDSADVTDNPTFDAMREGVMRSLKRFGVTGDSGLPRHGAVITVNQAEELRKLIGNLGSTTDPSVRMMRREMIDALDDDVVEGLGDDAFKVARASAKARFEEFKKTFAGKIADEGIAHEALPRRILKEGVRLSDLRSLRQSLSSGTPEQIARGQEAWKGLRAQSLDDLLAGSTDDEGKLLGGKLYRDFRNMAPKFRELLGAQDFKTLRRLVLASRDATVAPPMSSVNYANTAITQSNFFQMKPKVQEGWLKFLAKNGAQHAIAATVSFPAANVALVAGKGAAAAAAEQQAAKALAERVRLASNPEDMAVAVTELRKAAQSNAAARQALDDLGKVFGGIGGAAASQAQ